VNPLDMRTIVLSYMVTNIVCVLFVVLLWRQNRHRFAGTAFWVVDFIFQAVALFLIVMRGTIPDWISMVLSNTLVIVGAILGFVGLERFVGKKGPQIHNYLLVILFIFVHSYFALVQPNLAVRNFNIAVALLLICFQSVWLVWRRVEPGLRSLTFGVGAVNFLYCLLSSVRIAHFFIAPHVDSNYFQPVLFEALVLVSYQVLFILLTYSFVLMVNKRLLMQIGTQEEKFTKAFHSAPYAITITRPSDGTIVDVNETFVSMTGYDRTEVIGKKTIDLHLWEYDKDRAAVVEALTRTGGVHGMEMPFRKKSGEGITGLFSAEIITIDGEKSILSSIGDITERKRTEEALQQREHELQRKNAELERFTYAVSHDLKSPLVTVKTFLGYLEQDLARGDAGRIGKDILYMNSSTDKMRALLDELLELIQVGHVINPPVRIAFREIVDEALSAVAGRIAERGVDVHPGDDAVMLYGDRPRLAEIWQNLIENAVKYMGDQKNPRIGIGVEGEGRDRVFWVRDNGIGIDPRHQGKVFDLFEKLDPGTEGTGIGLTLVKRIVELYQGKIWLESEGVGHGTCFRFTLPDAVKQDPVY
jgi:PAS domain S-box-containing protein